MLLVIGHRGVAGVELENSMAGFKRAMEMSLSAVEFDVQMTSDGTPVVFHDSLLDRLTNASGYLKDFTIDQLTREVRLVNQEPIPLFEDVLRFLAVYDVKLYIELKSKQCGHCIQDILGKYQLRGEVVISSFFHNELLSVRNKNPGQKIMALFECSPVDPLGLVARLNPEEVGMGLGSLDQDVVSLYRENGIDTYAWTVNYERDYQLAINYGLNGIFSDFPQHIGR